MKDPEKIHAQSRIGYMKDLEKSCANSAAWSRESYKNDLKIRNDSSARSRGSYLKDPDKRHARNCESYMKDPEKSHADSAAWRRESYNIVVGSKS